VTLPYGPLRIDITLIGGGYQWRVGYGGNTLVRGALVDTPEEAIAAARVWCAGFRAGFVGVA
jgi:hypothetical protein